MAASLEEHSDQGGLLGRGCYKIRVAIASKGCGKSGSARVITLVKRIGETVYLLAVYDKSEQNSISKKELDELLAGAGLG